MPMIPAGIPPGGGRHGFCVGTLRDPAPSLFDQARRGGESEARTVIRKCPSTSGTPVFRHLDGWWKVEMPVSRRSTNPKADQTQWAMADVRR